MSLDFNSPDFSSVEIDIEFDFGEHIEIELDFEEDAGEEIEAEYIGGGGYEGFMISKHNFHVTEDTDVDTAEDEDEEEDEFEDEEDEIEEEDEEPACSEDYDKSSDPYKYI